jgi:UDP-glucose 4-epimerase
MSEVGNSARRVFITGADGFLGRSLLAELVREGKFECIVAADVRPVPMQRRRPGVVYMELDVRDPALGEQLAKYRIDTVVHLASIVTPGKTSSRAFEYSVDVLGSRNVLQACVAQKVEHIVVSSSGAAYGYYRDNPPWLRESDTLRGHPAFAYADHKRQVEEILADYRISAPALRQTVLRIGTILGEYVDNQITALFEKPRLLAIRGSESPFVFIWDGDVTGAILHGRRRCAHAARNRPAPGQTPAGSAGRFVASRAGRGQTAAPEPLWPRATGLPALPSRAAQHRAQDRVRLRAGQDQQRGF